MSIALVAARDEPGSCALYCSVRRRDIGITFTYTRFHALHWPALLMSANLPPPKRVLAHAHWTMSRSKMSKSRGNVVNPLEAMNKWGVDGVRWYLMRIGGSLAADAGEC